MTIEKNNPLSADELIQVAGGFDLKEEREKLRQSLPPAEELPPPPERKLFENL